MIRIDTTPQFNPPRPLAFVLAPTDQGTLIVNRFDYRTNPDGQTIGVGHMLLTHGTYDRPDVGLARVLLGLRRRHFGDGVLAVDCGANIGVFTVEWAKSMTGWGWVLAIEAQERIYYALAGNIAIANCFNARALHAAAGAAPGTLRIPRPEYRVPATFGSLELRQSDHNEFIGQNVSYADENLVPVTMLSIDSLALARLDLLKIDVEGMELEVLAGAAATIGRERPILIIEHIKTNRDALLAMLESHGYIYFDIGLNMLGVHTSDPTLTHIKSQD